MVDPYEACLVGILVVGVGVTAVSLMRFTACDLPPPPLQQVVMVVEPPPGQAPQVWRPIQHPAGEVEVGLAAADKKCGGSP